jgi:hypothetical protein
MHMRFGNSFSTFNPINGNFKAKKYKLQQLSSNTDVNSEAFPLILDLMAERARRIIASRRIKEINAAVDSINGIFYLNVRKTLGSDGDTVSIEQTAARLIAEFEIDKSTPAQLLKSNIPLFDITNDHGFPNAKWEEYFAILTLAALGNIHRFLDLDGEFSGASTALAAEGMEALIIGENPSLFQTELDRPLKEKISIRNARNVATRYVFRDRWKQQFAIWVPREYVPKLNGMCFNKRDAARQFWEEVMDPALKKEQNPEFDRLDVIRMLAESLPVDRPIPKQ